MQIQNIPSGASSLILIFEDIYTTPKRRTHWMLFNIPPNLNLIKEASKPKGAVEGITSNRSLGYTGPCPKYFKGTHHYCFRLYALDLLLNLQAAVEREEIEANMQDHIIETAGLLGLCTASE